MLEFLFFFIYNIIIDIFLKFIGMEYDKIKYYIRLLEHGLWSSF